MILKGDIMNILIVDNYAKMRPLDHLKLSLEEHEITTEVIRHNAPNLQTKADDFDALVLSGTENMLNREDLGEYKTEIALIKNYERPLLGICGGHQLIGIAYGSKVIALGYEVTGYHNVQIIRPNTLFRSLPLTIQVLESHKEIVNKLPSKFDLMAYSKGGIIEAMVHSEKPVYGVQFHPERYEKMSPHGRIILQNFIDSLKYQ